LRALLKVNQAVKEETEGTLTATLSSKERLDLNITSAFVELAINTLSVWQQKGDQVLQRARGGDAPYRIHNRTGDVIHVWSDQESAPKNAKAPQPVKIGDDEIVDWRFDDWKTMREVSKRGMYKSILLILIFFSMFPRPEPISLVYNSKAKHGSQLKEFLLTVKESLSMDLGRASIRSWIGCCARSL
jgi:hypothetical protein